MSKQVNTTTQLLRNASRTIRLVFRECPWLVIAILLVSVVTSVVPFAISGSQALVIDELIALAGTKTFSMYLVWGVFAMLLASLIPSILRILQRYLSKLFWFMLDAKFEIDIAEKRALVDVAAYESPKHNDLFTRVQENGVWRMQNFTERQFEILQNIIQVVVAAIILGLFEWWLVLLLVASTVPELMVQMKYGNNVWGLYGANAELKRRFWSLEKHFTWVQSITEIKLFQSIPYLLGRIRDLFLQFQDEQKKLERRSLVAEIVTICVSQIAILIVIVWAVLQVVNGNILVGMFTFLLASVGDFRSAISNLFRSLSSQYQDSLFVTDIFKLLDLAPLIAKPDPGVKLTKATVPEIVFENVSFQYPDTNIPVLSKINLHIKAGEKLAIVGVNGAGKTTLVKLLCRFYDPTGGRILVNGVDLRDIDLETWYKQMGILFQEYNRYNVPVMENISFGNVAKKPTLSSIKIAAEASEANSFIEQWPHKYKQQLGREFKGGIDPSVGQWQKLALARVFYRDPHVFVLDEPTASIDAEAEAHIFERLETIAQNKTVILISHRFSTVRKADTICILKDGSIVEQGSHSDLLAQNGTYAGLFKLQAKGYE